MPEIEIRPALPADIAALAAFEHNTTSDYVWQMDMQAEDTQIGVFFRQVRLPRPVRVDYPRPSNALPDTWQSFDGLLVALHQAQPCAYISLVQNQVPNATWVRDLVVERRLRHQGIGASLLLAAQEWALRQGLTRQIIVETQPKNFPAIALLQKLGYEFCGYNDRYYANHDIALFFARPLR